MERKLKGRFCLAAKISLILMLFCLQIQANGFSQQTRVSLKLGIVSVKQLFVEIEKLTDLAFVYNSDDVEKMGNVEVNFTNEEVSKILDYCLKETGFTYNFVNNHIVVKKAEKSTQQPMERTIKGKVMDKKTGEPLPGATIMIKGTRVGTATDIDGKFQMTIAADVNALEISFVGYKTITIPVSQKNDYIIMLETVTSEMDEVVVTGMFTRKADSYTGAVTTIKSDELQRVGNQNILQSLKNIDPSFQVLENNVFITIEQPKLIRNIRV